MLSDQISPEHEAERHKNVVRDHKPCPLIPYALVKIEAGEQHKRNGQNDPMQDG